MNRRMNRVNVLLREEISLVVATEVRDPRVSSVVSITAVETAPDLRHAKVFVSVLGGPSEKQSTLLALSSAAGFINRRLRRRLTLKAVPSLEFRLDESIERGSEVLQLIREAALRPETRDEA